MIDDPNSPEAMIETVSICFNTYQKRRNEGNIHGCALCFAQANSFLEFISPLQNIDIHFEAAQLVAEMHLDIKDGDNPIGREIISLLETSSPAHKRHLLADWQI